MSRRAPAWLGLLAALVASGAAAQTASLGRGEDLSSAVLAGRVCEDLDGDESCSPNEPGVAHARIVLSDGSFAVTDTEGRYHLVAIPSRLGTIDASGAAPIAREGYGRQLVKLDAGSLGRRALVRGGMKRMVEFGPAMLQAVDFAVSYLRAATIALEPAGRGASAGERVGGRYLYRVSGRVPPGVEVRVAGEKAPVDRTGLFTARAPLKAGENVVWVSALSADGLLGFHRLPVSVVERDRGGALFIPGPLERVATVELPPPASSRAGLATFYVRAPRGSRVRVGAGEAEVSERGEARLEVPLATGPNELAVELLAPGLPPAVHALVVRASGPGFTAAMLSLELGYDPSARELSLLGRGSALVQRSLGGFELSAGADLDVGDVEQMVGYDGLEPDWLVLLRPREPLAVERALDVELYPPATADDGLSGSMNPSHSRLWAHLRHPVYGAARLGSFHTAQSGAEIGRYERSLFGGLVDARLPLGPVALRAKGFGSPAEFTASGPVQAAAHDELASTGGSAFFLRNPLVLPGSEKLRVEIRDAVTGLPMEERGLTRYVDYDIDYDSGRVLLAQPLPISTAFGPLLGPALGSPRAVLVADYEFNSTTASRSRVLGGGAGIEAGGWGRAFASVVDERRLEGEAGDYRLYSVRARAEVGPVAVVGEAARSEGRLLPQAESGGFGYSDTGGLAWLVAPTAAEPAASDAFGLRASVSEEIFGASAWLRAREAGFNDSAHASLARARQVGGRARARLGPVGLSLFADDRVGADPRDPFGEATIWGRDAALRADLPIDRLSLSAEARLAQLGYPVEVGGPLEEGGRLGIGARAGYALTRELSVGASHHQRLAGFGEGPGSLDDTFTAAEASWRPQDELGFAVKAGWGPGVGTQVQVGAERAGEGEVGYGSFTVDPDGPDAGRAVVVSGARRRVEEQAEVFAEDLFARDLDALRFGRAVGLSTTPSRGLRLSGRYERATRLPFTGEPGLLRDVGSARASWERGRLRAGALAELRHERGDAVVERDVDRWQVVGGFAVEVRPLDSLGLAGRLNLSKTRNRGRTEAQSVEGTLGAGLRLHPWIVLASYSVINEVPPEAQGTAASGFEHLVSLRPAVLVGDRVRLGAGLHAGFLRGRAPTTLLAASIRPAVRLIGGLEVAVEAARRSAAPDGESLDALRAEIAWWLEESLGIALGYNLLGFSGTGVASEQGRTDRIYLRLEAVY